MSKEERIQKRVNRKRRNRAVLGMVILIVLVMVLISVYNGQTKLVKKTNYEDTLSAKVYFFKDMDYIELSDFKASDLLVDEGEKVNGYMALTSEDKAPDSTYLDEQIATIEQIIADGDYKRWWNVVDELVDNFVGREKVDSQYEGSNAQLRKTYLLHTTHYMGDTLEELEEKLVSLKALKEQGTVKNSLSELGLQTTGYIYASINSLEKMISERVLAYVDHEMLSAAEKVDLEESVALKVVNNDHLFACFEISDAERIEGAQEVLALKEENAGSTTPEKNRDYYNMLVKRVDLLREYPTLTVSVGDADYEAYVVDFVTDDEDNTIVVLMFKEYIGALADYNIERMTINLAASEAYTVNKSAIVEMADGETYIIRMETGLFPKLVPVTVTRYDGSVAVLPVDENDDVFEGMSYKVYASQNDVEKLLNEEE